MNYPEWFLEASETQRNETNGPWKKLFAKLKMDF